MRNMILWKALANPCYHETKLFERIITINAVQKINLTSRCVFQVTSFIQTKGKNPFTDHCFTGYKNEIILIKNVLKYKLVLMRLYVRLCASVQVNYCTFPA